MRHLFKITLDIETISDVKNSKLCLPEKGRWFSPYEEVLLTISIPEDSSNIYSLVI
jgi:hypothetical protein